MRGAVRADAARADARLSALAREFHAAMSRIWMGKGSDWIWGMDQRDPHIVNFDTQLVTSDRARFQRTQDFSKRIPIFASLDRPGAG